MIVYRDIDGDALTGVATGREYNASEVLLPLAPQEKIEYDYLIKMLRADYQLLKEAGDPSLLTHYALITQLLVVGQDPTSILTKHLPGDEFSCFKGRFIEDEKFRKLFDHAYHSHRLAAVRGEACAKGKERIISELGMARHKLNSWFRRN